MKTITLKTLIKSSVENNNNNKPYKKNSGKPQHTCTRLIKKFPHWLLNPSKNPLQFVLNLSVFSTDFIVYWKVQSWLLRATTSVKNLYWFILNQQLNTVLCFFAFTANWIYSNKWQFLLTIHWQYISGTSCPKQTGVSQKNKALQLFWSENLLLSTKLKPSRNDLNHFSDKDASIPPF